MESLFEQLKPALIQRLLNQSEISSEDLDNLRVVQSFQEGKSGAEVLEVESFLGVSKIEGHTVLKISPQSPWPDFIAEEERYQHLSQIQTLFAKLVWSTTLAVSLDSSEQAQTYTCTFWQRAHDQQPFHDMKQLNQLTQTEFSSALKSAGQRLLDVFSLDAQHYIRDASFTSLCEGVLGYRLHPKQGRIYTFVQDHFQVSWKKPVFRWAGIDFPDPYYYAREAKNLKLSRVYQGDIHGDLHPGNIFAVLKNGDAQDICLIDAGLSASRQILFYDQAYLEVSLLLQSALAQQETGKDWVQYLDWLSDLSNFELSDLNQKKGLHSEYLPLLIMIQALRSSFTAFLETKNNLSEDLRKQYHFQQICAALNFCNKYLNQIDETLTDSEKTDRVTTGTAQRRFAYLYAAFQLKSFLSKYGDDSDIAELKRTLEQDPHYLFKIELRKQDAYEAIWEKWDKRDNQQNSDIALLLKDYSELKKLKPYNRIPNYSAQQYARDFFYLLFHKQYSQLQNEADKLKLFGLLATSIQDYFSHYSSIVGEHKENYIHEFKQIKISENSSEDWFLFAFVLLEDAIFESDMAQFQTWSALISDQIERTKSLEKYQLYFKNRLSYYKLFLYAIKQDNFDFLNESIEKWKPEQDSFVEAEWLIKKSFLLTVSTFGKLDSALHILETGFEQLDRWPYSEQVYFSDAYLYLKQASIGYHSSEYNSLKAYFDDRIPIKGFRDCSYFLNDIYIKRIQKSLQEQNNKKKPSIIYGSDSDGKFTQGINALHILSFLVQMGIYPHVWILSLIEREKWEVINQIIFKDYPKISYFYSFRYIANDHIDAKWLRQEVKRHVLPLSHLAMRKELFLQTKNLYFFTLTPIQNYNYLSLALLSEYLEIYSYEKWADLFESVWNTFHQLDKKSGIYSIFKSGPFIFVMAALSKIKNEFQIKKCLEEFLKIDGDEHSEDRKIELLYELRKNNFFSSIQIDNFVKKLILKLIESLDDNQQIARSLTKLGNISPILTNELFNAIAEKLDQLKQLPEEKSLIKQINYFLFKGNNNRQKLKNLILDLGTKIWDNGIYINENGQINRLAFGKDTIIPLHFLKSILNREIRLTWNEDEVLQIYSYLRESIYEYKNSSFYKGKITNKELFDHGIDIYLLKEMYYFLVDYADVLHSQADYQNLKEEIMAGIQAHTPFSGRPSDLVSNDPNTVKEGLSSLRELLIQENFEDLQEYWLLLIFKIVGQQEPGLLESLDLLSYGLVYFREKEELQLLASQNYYLQILEKYQINFPPSESPQKIEKYLVKLAMVLDFWGENSETILYFIGLRKSSEYESVKNLPDLTQQETYQPQILGFDAKLLSDFKITDFSLNQVSIKGYKSFSNHQKSNVQLFTLNVFIGANGAGKSSFFKFLEFVQKFPQKTMSSIITEMGPPSDLLYYGSKETDTLAGSLTFNNSEQAGFSYSFECKVTKDFKGFYFNSERIDVHSLEQSKTLYESLQTQPDSVLLMHTDQAWAKILNELLASIKYVHIPDTSLSARLRDSVNLYEHKQVSSDGQNLAAFLYSLKNTPEEEGYFKQISRLIRHAFSQFKEFVLEPNFETAKIQLQWREEGSEHVFSAHQASDGSLRFMVLTALLMSPPQRLPRILILDEPELGLHPKALATLANMISLASQHCQILIATQSSEFLDHFEADDLVIVDRTRFDLQANEMKEKAFTVMTRKNSEDWATWLEDYTLSELWNKNVLGGKP